MSEHTPEPWRFLGVIGGCWVLAGQRHVLEYLHYPDEENRANAARIVACVNACKGIETAELESMSMKQLLDNYQTEVWQLIEKNKALKADADRLAESVKTNVYFARVIKQAAEEYLSSNGCPPEWWTIPLMHEIKELLGIVTETEARAALAAHESKPSTMAMHHPDTGILSANGWEHEREG